MSTTPVCGVRDYAEVTANALRNLGAEANLTWWTVRPDASFPEMFVELRRYLGEVRSRLSDPHLDGVIWNYSVFAYGPRGFPVLVLPMGLLLHRSRHQVITVFHEFVYAFGRRGWRGNLLAAAHRLVLPEVLAVSDAVVVTTTARARWLSGRRWLPRRPTTMIPVTSNLPIDEPRLGSVPREGPTRIGVFGFGDEAAVVEAVVEAVEILRQLGRDARLVLIGHPGRRSRAGKRWAEAAESRGLTDIDFTGTLPSAALVSALGRCALIVSPSGSGPEPRKSTLATTLALAVPVVAIDGPGTWQAIRRAQAVALTAPVPQALAETIDRLLRDPSELRNLGARGRSFYLDHMSPDRVAGHLLAIVAPP